MTTPGYTLLDVSLWSDTFEYVVKLDHAFMWIMLGFFVISALVVTFFMWQVYTLQMQRPKKEKEDEQNEAYDAHITQENVLIRRMQPIVGLCGFFFIMFLVSIGIFMRYNDLSQFQYYDTYPTYQLPGKTWTFQFNNILDTAITFTVLGSTIILACYAQEVEAKIFGYCVVGTLVLSILYTMNKAQYYTNTFWWLLEIGGTFFSAAIPCVPLLTSTLKDDYELKERFFLGNMLAIAVFAVWWGVVGGVGGTFNFVYADWETGLLAALCMSLGITAIAAIGTLVAGSRYAGKWFDQMKSSMNAARKNMDSKMNKVKGEKLRTK